MSEETTNTELNDGTWSGLKKTIIGTLGTLVAGGGTWLGVALFQGGESEGEEKVKTEQTAQPNIILNVDNSSQNNSSNGGGNTVIREKVVEKPAKPIKEEKEKKSESTDAPW
jgi:hypothetical protein